MITWLPLCAASTRPYIIFFSYIRIPYLIRENVAQLCKRRVKCVYSHEPESVDNGKSRSDLLFFVVVVVFFLKSSPP